jgi:outer membrane scaffolding protein for murein synthesis (MipA/OmpV family)
MDFAGDRYANYYFGITPEESLLTGGALPVYNAGGGLKDWKASLLVNQSITGDLLGGISIFGLGQYSHLEGDFKRSPIVAQRGSATQWTGSLGLAYTW